MTPQRSAKLHFLTPAKAANKGDTMKLTKPQIKTLMSAYKNDGYVHCRDMTLGKLKEKGLVETSPIYKDCFGQVADILTKKGISIVIDLNK